VRTVKQIQLNLITLYICACDVCAAVNALHYVNAYRLAGALRSTVAISRSN